MFDIELEELKILSIFNNLFIISIEAKERLLLFRIKYQFFLKIIEF